MLFPSADELDCCDLILFVDSTNLSFIALTSLELPAVFDSATPLSCLAVCGRCLSLVVSPILLVILLTNGC